MIVELEKWRTFHSFQEQELGENIAKSMARTATRQLEGRHLLFGEYLPSWKNLNVHYRRRTEHRRIDGGKHVLAMFLN